MRVIIASTYVPFIKGGGTLIVESLESALRERGHEVDTVLIPFRSYWPELPEQTLAIRALDLTESAGNRVDRLITIRYPSFALQHPNKVAWFIHHHRGAYDLWGTAYQDIPNSEAGLRARENLIQSDTRYLRECRRIYTNSGVVARRLETFNGLHADGVLFPPLPNPEAFRHTGYGDYFLYTARVVPIKRQALAIEAMQHVRAPFSLVLAGAADSEPYLEEMRALARRLGVADRVQLLGWVSEEAKAELTNGAFAALYIPFDEDSYGYSTLEAFHASKPVITLRDSGGTDEVIRDGFNGLIVDPTPEALAEGMERLWSMRRRIEELGANALATLRIHRIDWDHVIAGLLG